MPENQLNRDFTANGLGEKWVSDLTYIKTAEGWIYLTAILDLANRKEVGWALSETMRAEDTSVAALKMAFKNYPVKKPLLFHRTGDPVRQRRSIRVQRIS